MQFPQLSHSEVSILSIEAGENRRFRAGLAAGIALNAAVGEKGDLPLCLMGFRIVAPGAPESTTLKKEHRSYSRPVVKTEPLDIKDEGLHHAYSNEQIYSRMPSSTAISKNDFPGTMKNVPAG